ncbi:MAG TPA: hypothetical protein VNA88_13845, partial [Candidatus Kapabacteria bacterium]|nr:hypothetical protein [Candidatus Kapabacteria bacterium]
EALVRAVAELTRERDRAPQMRRGVDVLTGRFTDEAQAKPSFAFGLRQLVVESDRERLAEVFAGDRIIGARIENVPQY